MTFQSNCSHGINGQRRIQPAPKRTNVTRLDVVTTRQDGQACSCCHRAIDDPIGQIAACMA